MIWNPWKALDAAEQEITRLRNLVAERDEENDTRLRELAEVRLRAKLAEAHVSKLNKELAQGHFRNPKTGRLGRKGERFK